MARGSCIICLIIIHLEYFALLVEKVRMWRKVAITHRRFYNERMKRAYSTNLRPPTELGIGEFCYLRVPYLSTITSHVKRFLYHGGVHLLYQTFYLTDD